MMGVTLHGSVITSGFRPHGSVHPKGVRQLLHLEWGRCSKPYTVSGGGTGVMGAGRGFGVGAPAAASEDSETGLRVRLDG